MFKFKITENQNESGAGVSKGIKVENVPLLIVLFLVFILPIFFLPAQIATLDNTKLFIVYIATLVSVFVYVLLRLKDQVVSLPFNLLSLSMVSIPVVYIASGFFSKTMHLSFFGRDFALDSVLTILALFVLLAVSVLQFKNKLRVIYLYVALLASFLFVAFIHLLNIFIPALPSFGVFNGPISTTIGKWNDLALFSSLVASLSIMTLLMIRLAKVARIIIYVALGLATLIMIIVNFTIAWYVLGVFSILFFIYIIVGHTGQEKQVPLIPLFAILLAFLFIVAGGVIGGQISKALSISHFEVRPSWSSTIEVTRDTLSKRPILGSGPTSFETDWLEHKPQSVLGTDFWNLDFRYGVGLISSFVATTGVLGMLTWLFFFGLLLWTGFKTIFKTYEDNVMKFLLLSSFVMSVMLWVFSIIYLPSSFLLVLAFVMTGAYVSLLNQVGMLKNKRITLDNEPKFGFLYITVLVLILIGSIAFGYHVTSKFIASVYFQRAIVQLNFEGNLEAAEISVNNALKLDYKDTYLRSLGEIDTIRISRLLQDNQTSQEVLVGQFRNHLSSVIDNYKKAIEYDKYNYHNYLSLANIYRDLMAINVQGSYEQALEFYNEVLKIKVNSPDIYLELAKLEMLNKNTEAAKNYISMALGRKPNYTDAVFLYSQISVDEGNIQEAINAVESASIIKPNDSTIFFQLGLLRYNNNNFDQAVAAFERAILLSPEFQNAKYFLGLSYDKVGNDDAAIAQFRDLKVLNPDNTEVSFILNNLENGRSAFADVAPPLDETPEDRPELPLDDGEIEEEIIE